MANMASESGSQFVAPGNACRSVDLAAVLVNSEETSLRLQNVRIDSGPVTIPAAVELNSASTQAFPKHGGLHRVRPGPTDTPLLATILRI